MLPNRETDQLFRSQLWLAQCDFIYCTYVQCTSRLNALIWKNIRSIHIFGITSQRCSDRHSNGKCLCSQSWLLILSVGYYLIFWLILFHAVLLICYLVLGFYISKRQSSKSQWQVCFSCWWLCSLGHWSARINQVMNQNVHFIFPYKPWTWAVHGE